MRGRRMSGSVPLLLSLSLLMLTVHPIVLAESAWEEDGWLRTSYADERLEAGDEFGCYGIPGLSWFNDPGAVASACKTYIEERTNASQWGVSPLSTFTPNTLTMADHQRISSQGFTVHGDETGLVDSAWHDADDMPVDLWDWYNLGRRGGSLEKGVASLETLQEEVEAGGLVNMYWIGRVNDATVRHDRDVLNYLDEAPNIWLTTWGEVWSSWSAKRCYEFTHTIEEDDNGSILTFESLITDACTGASDGLPWNVPLTWLIDTDGHDVVEVRSPSGPLESIEGEKNTNQGWWQQDDGTVVLSIVNGHQVEVVLNGSNITYDILGQSKFFNNHSAAVTVAGHETTDLFKWSKRFLEDTSVRFTWLLQPRLADGEATWIPYAIVGIGFATVVGMLGVLGREGVGPLAGLALGKGADKSPPELQSKRSLDAVDEAE
ncbi:MAG: hypothetical protein CMA86_00785 [Euryarchaeota archaeon]|nr:hypothetical protein [Euryarchaeota archaeon]